MGSIFAKSKKNFSSDDEVVKALEKRLLSIKSTINTKLPVPKGHLDCEVARDLDIFSFEEAHLSQDCAEWSQLFMKGDNLDTIYKNLQHISATKPRGSTTESIGNDDLIVLYAAVAGLKGDYRLTNEAAQSHLRGNQQMQALRCYLFLEHGPDGCVAPNPPDAEGKFDSHYSDEPSSSFSQIHFPRFIRRWMTNTLNVGGCIEALQNVSFYTNPKYLRSYKLTNLSTWWMLHAIIHKTQSVLAAQKFVVSAAKLRELAPDVVPIFLKHFYID